LRTRSGGLGARTTGGTQLDVESCDAHFAAAGGNILCGKHGGIWRRFISIGFYFHPAYQDCKMYRKLTVRDYTKDDRKKTHQ
jgi:hypothetical protein